MTTVELSGLLVIPVTPFAADGSVHTVDLARQVEFCVSSGADGIVYPAVVSEFFTLSEDERRTALRTVIDAAAGAVPVVAGVAAPSGQLAAQLAEHAAGLGCAAVMAMPPYVSHFFSMPAADVVTYYDRIASAGLPIIAQNARIGHQLSLTDLGLLLDGVPQIRWLKQEVGVSTHAVSAAVERFGSRLDGVFAGLGSIWLVNELDRGATGTMPAPPYVDIIADALRDYTSGDRTAAVERLTPLGALFTYELLYNVEVIKYILVRRGVISSTICRAPVPGLDAVDRRTIGEAAAAIGL